MVVMQLIADTVETEVGLIDDIRENRVPDYRMQGYANTIYFFSFARIAFQPHFGSVARYFAVITQRREADCRGWSPTDQRMPKEKSDEM